MDRPGVAKIMVIEDEPDLMWLITHILNAAGFNVVQAYGGEDALRKVKTFKPDLLLTDLAMPRMSGVELIQKVKADPETQHIPIVVVTAYMWDHLAQSAGSVGADGFIAKPFNTAQFLQEVAKYVRLPAKSAAPSATRRV
jgi:CheY-like chemotaxis protein